MTSRTDASLTASINVPRFVVSSSALTSNMCTQFRASNEREILGVLCT
jgi:hypothetical protein